MAPVLVGPPDPLIGQTVARCRVEERIGEGRTSVVYRGMHGSLGMPVALKILKPAVLAFPDIVAKFEVEARAIARLDHPNVLKIYDVAAEGDRHCIVMELLEGESVLELLEGEERVVPSDALRIVRQAASGLVAAHSKHIIHRDVKPQNLVILGDGTVKLVDFGLATEADSDGTSSRIGTPHYMSPEVCGARPAEPTSDVYSLGITLYHLLVGSPPYAGMSVREILEAHAAGKPLHPERRLPGLPKAICDLVRDMTKRDPLTRPIAQEVVDAVDKIGGKELAASPRLKVRRARRGGGGRVPPVAIVGAAVVLAVVLVLLLAKGGGGDSPAPHGPGPLAGGPGTGTPTPASSPTPPPDTVQPTTPPALPPETVEQRRAREEAAKAARQRQGEVALGNAAEFARANWQDKVAVVREYRTVASQFRDTESGKEAKRRADLIDKGEMHPHPDRTYAAPDAIDIAKAAWEEARPKVEAAFSAMRYEEAADLVPPGVEDKSLSFAEELDFWRRLAHECGAFLAGLPAEVERLPTAERKVKTAQGDARIVGTTTMGLRVEVGDERLDVRWSEIAPADLATLAAKAFAGRGLERNVQLAQFAFAHRLRDVFYRTAIAVQASGETGPSVDQVSRALARATERFPKARPK